VCQREARCESVDKKLKFAKERHSIRARGKGALAKGKMREREREEMRGQGTLCEREAQCVSEPCAWARGAVWEQEVLMNKRLSEADRSITSFMNDVNDSKSEAPHF
jgi:hypothetical protein